MSVAVSYNVATAAAATGMSRSAIKKAIASGALRAKATSVDDDSKRVTGIYVIPSKALEDWIDGMPDV